MPGFFMSLPPMLERATERSVYHSSNSHFMERALELAARGGTAVRPNPKVGAVVVRDGRVIGEGFHERYGETHAEVNALQDCRVHPESATMYCTLEPCCFSDATKHQPPCTDAIIRSGIRSVLVAQIDPNPKVSGRGVAQLRAAGVNVEVGVLSRRAALLNPGFNTEMAYGRPFVHLKWAQTLDGRIATVSRDSRWITDDEARHRAHELRSESDAVLVGVGTLLADDPLLTVRSHSVSEQPRPVVLDTRLRTPPGSRLVRERGAELIVITGAALDPEAVDGLARRGVHVVRSPLDEYGRLEIGEVLQVLRRLGIRRLFVEGGASVLGSFLQSGLYDRLSVFTAPVVLGSGLPAAAARPPAGSDAERIADADRLVEVAIERIGDQSLTDGFSERWMDRVAGPCIDARSLREETQREETYVYGVD